MSLVIMDIRFPFSSPSSLAGDNSLNFLNTLSLKIASNLKAIKCPVNCSKYLNNPLDIAKTPIIINSFFH